MKRFCVVFLIRPECALQFWLFISSFFFSFEDLVSECHAAAKQF